MPPRFPHSTVSPPAPVAAAAAAGMVQQSSFRVFARLHGQRHSRIVNVDILRPPNLKTLILSIASKLKVKPPPASLSVATSQGTCSYQLLLNDQAVVEHVSELRDGDTVVLHVLSPPLSAAAAAPRAGLATVKEEKKQAPPKGKEVITLEDSEDEQSRSITTTAVNLAPAFRAEAAIGPSRNPAVNTSQTSPQNSPNNTQENRVPSPTNSITSVNTLAHSVVQAAAAHIKNLGENVGSDEDTSTSSTTHSSEASSDQKRPAINNNTYNNNRAVIQSIPTIPNRGLESPASFDTDKTVCSSHRSSSSKKSSKRKVRRSPGTSVSATKNQVLPLAKRRKKVASTGGVRWSTQGQAASDGGIKPDALISASKFDIAPPPPQKPQAHIPEYAVGKRYFLAYYDGHQYPVTITGGIRRSNGTRRVQMDVFKVKLSVRMEELLPATPEREELWSSTCMPDAGSLCSFSSRCSTRSTKSIDFKKYGPPTNPSQCRALAMKLRDTGYGDGRLQGRWLAQRNRIVYFCCDNESVLDIQKKFPRVSVGKILYDNRPTWGKNLQKTSRMHTESFFVLPKAYYGRAVASFDNTNNEFMIPSNSCFSVTSGASRA